MCGHLNSFAKLPRISPDGLWRWWRESETVCSGVNIRTCRQPICARNVQSGLFHILESHLLSVLPEAIILFISCRSVWQKGYMHQQVLLRVLWLIGWPFSWTVSEDTIFAILAQEAIGISRVKIFNITTVNKPFIALKYTASRILILVMFKYYMGLQSIISYFSVLFDPEHRTARRGVCNDLYKKYL